MSEAPQPRMTRIATAVSAEYQYKHNRGECTITDFSKDGIAIEANQILLVGDLIRIKAKPDREVNLDIWCVVRSVQGRKISLEFEEISNEMRQKLQECFCNLLQTSGKKRLGP